MNERHLTPATLRLFLVLEALLEEGGVTRAARRLNLTQSAVSHALKRLRALYADDLVVQTPGGMLPTPLAQSLLPALKLGLAELDRVLNAAVAFDPATSRRTFTLATVDHPQISGLPTALARIAAEAPGVDVRVRGLRPGLAQALESGDLDGVFAGGEIERELALDRGLTRTVLAREPFRCIVRPGNPLVGEALDLDTYCRLGHVLVSTAGAARGMVDDAQEAMGRARRVAVTVPAFVGAPHAVAATDLIATVPRTIAAYGERFLGLRVLLPPLELPIGVAYLWWHQRLDNDPGHRWWRRLLHDTFAPYRA